MKSLKESNPSDEGTRRVKVVGGLLLAEVVLWGAGLLGAGSILWGVYRGRVNAHAGEVIAARSTDGTLPATTEAGDPEVLGSLEIKAIGLRVPVLRDYDPKSLKQGVGHIGGTALPGGLGNVGLAGHRDTFFRPLRHVATGMEIRVSTSAGTFHYVVDSTEKVTPEQVRVLDIRSRPELTLITCYPFDFIGSAPERFIVHAHLLSLDPD